MLKFKMNLRNNTSDYTNNCKNKDCILSHDNSLTIEKGDSPCVFK